MENQVHFRFSSILLHHCRLAALEDIWTKLHSTRLIMAMDISKGSGKGETSDRMERFVYRQHIFWRRIEVFIRRIFTPGCPIFFAPTTPASTSRMISFSAASAKYSFESEIFSSKGRIDASNMWFWKRLFSPLARRSAVASISGFRNVSAALGWQ